MKVDLQTWDDVAAWVDSTHVSIPASYLDKVNKRKYPVDAFSLGQLASKAWLLQTLHHVTPLPIKGDWAILGCWVGSIVPFLARGYIIDRIYGFDMDPASIELADEFNRELVVNNWKFKGVVANVDLIDWSDAEFEVSGQLIQTKPAVLINTSCEHMPTDWFETADSDQLIVMQTNNNPNFDGHVNICSSVEEMQEKYPLSDVKFVGELVTPFYSRLMQIGYK